MIDNGFTCNRLGGGHKLGTTDCHVHVWCVAGDGNYEHFYYACETCGEREPDPLEEDGND